MSEDSQSGGQTSFTLFTNEERVLDDAERMIRSLEAVGDGVQSLAKAYRRSYDEQRRLLRVSDRVQNDLHGANQRLSEKTRELETVNEQLRKTNEQKDLLFSIIGHDLRNPFSIVSGYTQYLHSNAETLPRDTIRDMAGRAQEAASAVSRLLDTLLEWARVQNDQMECHLRPTPLQDIIDEVLSLYDSVAERKGVALHVANSANLTVVVDPDMTSTVLRNLFNNALKFTPADGEVRIAVLPPSAGENVVGIAITDTGEGITPTVQANLFTPDAGKAKPGTWGERGLGLGLPICKKLAERQGGSISVDSEVGRGSTFTLYLPAH